MGILLEISETQPITAQSSVLLHPQEEATRIRMAARQKQVIEIFVFKGFVLPLGTMIMFDQ